MSISSEVRKSPIYVGNGSTTVFSFTFKVFSSSDVAVVKSTNGAETTLVLGVDYTVSLNTNQDAQAGGSITLTTPPLSTDSIVITSNVSALQPVTLGGTFYPQTLNDALDRLTIIVQQLKEKVGRAVTATITSGIDPQALLASILSSAASAVSSASDAATSATSAANSATSATNAANNAASNVSTQLQGYVNSASSSATNAANSAASINPANIVHTTNDETIAGIKNFVSSPLVPVATTGMQAVGFTQFINATGIPLPTKVAYNQINVNGTTLTLSSPVAGTDYYFSLSAITTTIQEDTIGGFHYGLIPNGETPTGNKTATDITAIAGINQYSIWTKWFRSTCDPRGMVYINGRWYDIYLMDSGYGIRKYSAPTSITGLSIAGGAISNGRQFPLIPDAYGGNGSTNYGKFTWFNANEIAKASGKELISYNDFPTIAYGVQEQVDASSQDGGIGNVTHFANLTSKWGVEQATGTQWIWGRDVGSAYANTDFGWKTGLTDARGDIYATSNNPIAVRLGAGRGNGSSAGSRASSWTDYVWDTGWYLGSRFSCDHMKLV